MKAKTNKTKLKIAIFQFFLTGSAIGGAERLMIDLKKHLGCDFWVGGLNVDTWSPQNNLNPFVDDLFKSQGKVNYLHKDSKIPVWRVIKRLFNLKFNPKVGNMNQYDIIIFSFGNIFFLPQRLSSKVFTIGYCHTPPRYATDQKLKATNKFNPFLRPFFNVFATWILRQWTKSFDSMDYKIANSKNIMQRVVKYTGISADEVIFPPVDIDRFQYISDGDYYLSYARLEEVKRIPLILEAFKLNPDKKLVICSGGPMENYVKDFIKENNLTNIQFLGRVSDQKLAELVGNCFAGIYIPEDEDAGMTQLELMAAGKPVIGVREGGLLETIVAGKHGLLLPANPTVKDLSSAIKHLDLATVRSMKSDCIAQAKLFSSTVFLDKIDKAIQQFR
jgi:glycosyltransferase involved in cell wall biosynthesis